MMLHQQAEGKALRESVILGVFFMMLVTTYSSFSHIVSYIAEHSDDLYTFEGEVVLILNYAVYLIGLTRAPAIRHFKKQFQIAALCYATNYALYLLKFNSLLGLIVSCVGAAVGGFGASVLWVSQGGYMMRLFRQCGISKNEEGYYLGIQNALVFASVLAGAIIITFGLGLFGSQIYFTILTCIGLLAFLLCTFFLDSLEEGEENEEAKPFTWRQFKQNIKQMVAYIPKMKYLFAAMILDGLMLGFLASYFSHLIPERIRSELNVGITLMINGVGAMLGAYLSGYLSDKISPPQLGIMGFLFIILTMLFTLLGYNMELQTLTYPCVLGALWGVCLYFLEGWIFVCCAKVCQGRIESFAIVKQVHTLSFILFQIYMIIVSNNINAPAYLILLIILASVAIYSCRQIELSEPTKHQQVVEERSPPE